jgi:shikimate kinase
VGKTTLGRALAARLGWGFIDTDAALGARVGMAAGEYLQARGEAAFRAVEQEVVLAALAGAGRVVVALGGGAVSIAAVRVALRTPEILTVALEAPVAVLAERQAQAPRPRLTTLPLAEEIADLVARRRAPQDEVAQLRLDTGSVGVAASCEELLARISWLL